MRMLVSGTELINPFKVLESAKIQQGFQVADLGCGALGHFVFPAAQLVGGNGAVYAVDLDKDVVRAIERKAKHAQIWNVHAVWSDIEVVGAARIQDASLDLVIVANNFYLAQHREGVVREALRLLKPWGSLLVIEWTPEPSPLGPPPERRMSTTAIRTEVMRVPGWEYDGEFSAGDHHDAIVFRKKGDRHHAQVLAHSTPHPDDLALHGKA